MKLREGDLVAFNQRRMLHGRNAFSGGGGLKKRHLQGCYVRMDDFLSRHRALTLQFAEEAAGAAVEGEGSFTGLPRRGMDTVSRCSNQSW